MPIGGTAMGTEGTVTYELCNGVAWLGLNRLHKRNAIGGALLAALGAAVRRAQDEARALVIFGHGPCFSAGLDLSEQRARQPAQVFHGSRAWQAAFSLLRHGPIPAIAALHGATIGGGLELAAACHIRVADETAFFALPEGTRGIYVGGGASVHVARLLGASRMADMMLTGRVLDAAAAERAGLVQYLVPQGEAKSKAGELAAKVAAMVAPGEVVALVLPNSIEFPIAYFAALRVLAAPALLNPRYPAAQLATLLREATARAVICAPATRDMVTGLASDLGISGVVCLGQDITVAPLVTEATPAVGLRTRPARRSRSTVVQRRHHRASQDGRAYAWSPCHRRALRGISLAD